MVFIIVVNTDSNWIVFFALPDLMKFQIEFEIKKKFTLIVMYIWK